MTESTARTTNRCLWRHEAEELRTHHRLRGRLRASDGKTGETVADETRECPSTNECAKADGSQPAEPIRDSGLCAATKVRMYGCNRNLSAASREEQPGKAGSVHVETLGIEKADLR